MSDAPPVFDARMLSPRHRARRAQTPMEARRIMLLVAFAFVVGGTLGAVITATLVASGRRASMQPAYEMPPRTSNRWITDAVAARDERSYDVADHVDSELARRLGREASATARKRAIEARRALRPAFGITFRMKP
jgi:hypothetical protein